MAIVGYNYVNTKAVEMVVNVNIYRHTGMPKISKESILTFTESSWRINLLLTCHSSASSCLLHPPLQMCVYTNSHKCSVSYSHFSSFVPMYFSHHLIKFRNFSVLPLTPSWNSWVLISWKIQNIGAELVRGSLKNIWQ